MRATLSEYRYRFDGSTHQARSKFDFVLKRLGTIREIQFKRYFGRYNTIHEGVFLRGENGTARLGGLLWGYGGEGPTGTVELLTKIGFDPEEARKIAYTTKRHKEVGIDLLIAIEEKWTHEDEALAFPFGWGLFLNDGGPSTIEALDDPEGACQCRNVSSLQTFNGEDRHDKAIRYVQDQAKAGNKNCQKALRVALQTDPAHAIFWKKHGIGAELRMTDLTIVKPGEYKPVS